MEYKLRLQKNLEMYKKVKLIWQSTIGGEWLKVWMEFVAESMNELNEKDWREVGKLDKWVDFGVGQSSTKVLKI